MSKLSRTILLTFMCWLLATVLYAYNWVSAILAEPGVPVYERNGLMPLLAFAVYRLPYLLIGLVIIIVVEWIIIPGPDRKPPSMI